MTDYVLPFEVGVDVAQVFYFGKAFLADALEFGGAGDG